MIREQFFQDVAVTVKFQQIWAKVLQYEEKTGKSIDTFSTMPEFIDLFDHMALWDSAAFALARTCVTKYITYLVEHDVLPKKALLNLTRIPFSYLTPNYGGRIDYFKNVNILQEAIEYNLRLAPPTTVDTTVYSAPICALFLSWLGLTEEEIITFRKDQVLPDGVLVNGEKLELPPFALETMNRYRTTDGYYRKSRGVIFRPYQESDFLLRSDVFPQLTLENLRAQIYKFNKLSNQELSLLTTVAYRSGIFHRAYMIDCQSVEFPLYDREFLESVFHEKFPSKAKMRHRIQDYLFYKKLYS